MPEHDPDFDPTRVDWNNPDVEYLMKHFKAVMTSRDDETAALTRSNEELRTGNEELRRAYGELEAKYEASSQCMTSSRAGAARPDPAPRRAPTTGRERIPQGGAATT